ncbi:APC family permease [Neisseria sp. ZJ106]|uniref:APC family permease n=1 Tax=Neisseria lisongii TaxID=2912188 RepID=A0ABY7RJ51_9NEIS|nr:APC family permease [Neisseria lisongii]MCF7522018.1 APC family permease [Neisseria lisongii]WCL71095.1 APC family permease [Neisseria lisongii]
MSDQSFKKSLGSLDVVALAFGAMIGWGWVVLAGSWVLSAGVLGSVLAFLLGGSVVLFIGLTYAELAASMPVTGGEHTYTYRAMGIHVSFFCSWMMLMGYLSVVAFEAVALPTVVEYLVPNYNQGFLYNIAGWDVYASWVAVGMIGSVVMTWINIRGVEVSAWFQKAAVFGILAVGIMLFVGALMFHPDELGRAPDFAENKWAGIMMVMVMVPFMFVGFDVIPQAAEEIDLTRPKIALYLMVSLVIAVMWYMGIAWSVGTILTPQEISGSPLATADAIAKAWGGNWAGTLLIIAGVLGILSSWNAFLMGGSRLIYAMSLSYMLPESLGKLHAKYQTPVTATLLLGGLATIAPLFGRKMLVWIVDAGGLGVVIAYTLVALSFLVLRIKEPKSMVRPVKIPAGKLVGVLTLLAAGSMIYLYLPGSPSALIPVEWAIFAAWTVFGILLYLYALKKFPGKSKAFMDEEIVAIKEHNQKWWREHGMPSKAFEHEND